MEVSDVCVCVCVCVCVSVYNWLRLQSTSHSDHSAIFFAHTATLPPFSATVAAAMATSRAVMCFAATLTPL
jgi:hypothetical protein